MDDIRTTVAFGVAGEGRGHAARTIALSQRLGDRFRIVIFAPPSIRSFLSEGLPDAEIIDIPGINFHKENHVIKYRKTLLKNLTNIGRIHPDIKRITALMKENSVDAVISDFEPYTAVAAKELGLPVLSLNHPGIVLRYFSMMPDALAAKLAAKIMMPAGTKELLCSFYGGDVGPILRQEIRNIQPTKKDYYVVYTKEESRGAILEALKKYPEKEFRVFPDKNMDFIESFANCKGVISSSGHQMLSESLYLKKPVLAFPQKMQFEQRLNAIMLEQSGWGMEGNIKKIEDSLDKFFNSIESFPLETTTNETFLFTDYTQAAANCISAFVESEIQASPESRKKPFSYGRHRPAIVQTA
ncbi:MAG: glycosyltransferase family protein [Spirochaetales bacterium]|nr:glycosyltransferase family protein [Spirochaetales bacterium]